MMIRLFGRIARFLTKRRKSPRSSSSPIQRSLNTHGFGQVAGCTIFVIGGGRIGRATSEAFIAAGARVHLADIRAGLAPEGAIEHVVDVSDIEDIERFWRGLHDPIDILVHAVGYQAPVRAFEDATDAQWRRTFDTNLFGLMRISQLVGVDWKKRRHPGSMIFIVSAHHAITGGWPEYAASKAAVVMFMRELALEWAPWGIRVNAIAPGWVADPNEQHATDFPHTPLGQCAIPPQFIAYAALFLASDQSAFTTGTVMLVDGGLSLRSYRTAANVMPEDPHVRRYDDG